MAGGTGTRLAPLTNPLNKHVLPVGDRPMIVHVIESLINGGVQDILVLLNGRHPELLLEMLGDGSRFGCEITFKYQPETVSVSYHLLMAQNWVGQSDFVLMLGDSIFFAPLEFTNKTAPHMWVMPLDAFDDPSKYGQVILNGSRVERLIEKPRTQISNIIQTGAWLLPSDIFNKIKVAQKKWSGCDELHIGLIIPEYVEEHRMTYSMLPPSSYIDCGTLPALRSAAEIVWKQQDGSKQKCVAVESD